MATPDTVIAELRTWIGVPWRHQGRSRFGIDCAGLIAVAATEIVGAEMVKLHDKSNYARSPNQYDLVEALDLFCNRIDVTELRKGDIVAISDGPYPCHLAVITEQYNCLYMIHSSARLRKVAEEPFSDFWKAKLSRCYRPRDYK